MKGYWIVKGEISNLEGFKQYTDVTPDIISKFGGRFIIRAGKNEIVEGNSKTRNTVIEFPSYQDALSCWHSEEYKAAKKLREGHAEFDIVVIEGYAS